ncbi:hypothetical protein [Gracilibacillus thailandensis]|jgi:hypothetical protein|uniref:Uncharacterized protein n=1 Tax=Gracilibacillus thailandensis TaxID=563735 RepID=A0A6N7R4J6_9BACI|nr:hypothetical protein [Gracilibacillus thailandensis]MRI68114.1 hypothetical protein [Gracilibacillus thailandensis]
MWFAGLSLLFIVLIIIDAKQLWKRKNKRELILYFSFLTTAYFLFIVNRLHLFSLESFSSIQIITDFVQLFLPMDHKI